MSEFSDHQEQTTDHRKELTSREKISSTLKRLWLEPNLTIEFLVYANLLFYTCNRVSDLFFHKDMITAQADSQSPGQSDSFHHEAHKITPQDSGNAVPDQTRDSIVSPPPAGSRLRIDTDVDGRVP